MVMVSMVRPLGAVCAVAWALAGCGASADPEPVAEASPSTGSASGQQGGRSDALAELAASAGEAPAPTLLLIANETTHTVVITGARADQTATIDPGGSLSLGSERACDWLPLTASTSDGRPLGEYAQPCDGQTWTITD